MGILLQLTRQEHSWAELTLLSTLINTVFIFFCKFSLANWWANPNPLECWESFCSSSFLPQDGDIAALQIQQVIDRNSCHWLTSCRLQVKGVYTHRFHFKSKYIAPCISYVFYRLKRRSSWWMDLNKPMWRLSWSCVHALQDKLEHHTTRPTSGISG